MSDSDQHYFGVLLEEIRDQNRAVLEAVGAMQRDVAQLPQIQADIQDLTSDIKVVKAAVTATNRDLADLDQRVSQLEQTTS